MVAGLKPDRAPEPRVLPSVLPLVEADVEQAVPARFERVVAQCADRVALTGAGRRWTYRELGARTSAIAHAIQDRTGAGPGRVAYLAELSPEMVVATLAVLKAGKTYLAIHPGAPAARQAEIVADVEPELLLATGAMRARALELSGGAIPVLVLDDIPERPDAEGPTLTTGPGDPSTLFYTSGTTGRPKGVQKSHRAVMHRVWLAVQHDRIGPDDRISLLTHTAFSASESDMFGALLNGATLAVFDFAAEGLTRFRAWIEAERITVLHPPVLLFRRFLAGLNPADRFPLVRLVALAGDKVLPSDIVAWRQHFPDSGALMHRFSTTETGLLCVARIDGRTVAEGEDLLAGRPVDGKLLSLVGADGAPVLVGDEGELVVTSRYIADGYWRRPSEAFAVEDVAEGRRTYRTGDRGKFRPDGSFVFVGRRDRQVKIRGFRVEVGEVEAAIAALPGVREAAVVVGEAGSGDTTLAAFVVAGGAPAPTIASLRQGLLARLPAYMVPGAMTLLDALPVTPTGKVDRQSLANRPVDAMGAAAPEPVADLVADPVERTLVAVWQEVLGRGPVGPDDNFFDLGGHSLQAAQAFARIEQRLRIQLPLGTLLQAPTPRALARVIRERTAAGPSRSLVAIQPAGHRLPIFALPGIGGNVVGYHDLAKLLGPDQPFYGLQARGLDGAGPPLASIEAIAAAHLAEVRAVQPTGPYLLMGACMGGVVAYEMAQQLVAAGQQVAGLVLIETPVPDGAEAARVPARPSGRLGFVLGRLRLYARTFAALEGRERIAYVRGRLRTLRRVVTRRDPFEGSRGELLSQMVTEANRAAFRRYRARPYGGSVVHVRAERPVEPGADRRDGWSALVTGGLAAYASPGADSGLMLVPPNVEPLARRLRTVVEAFAPERPAAVVPPGPGPDTVADAFLAWLVAHGVEFVFINPGSDVAPIQEAAARCAALGRRAPRLVLCLHESVALAAAHGYFMVTGRPQVVLVHADVGTLNLGANLHNAQRGRAGVVICAGTPPSPTGEPGGRDRSMDWIQDQFNQASGVDAYVKWHHRVAAPGTLTVALRRAFQLAAAAPAGPVYLALPRDVLSAPAAPAEVGPAGALPSAAGANRGGLAQAAAWLLGAERPLIVTASSGRNPATVGALVRLAEVLGAGVVETRHRVNFPTTHPLHLGFHAFPPVREADCILVVDHDVPWVPAEGSPAPGCRVIQVDVDPLKGDMPLWDFPVDLAIAADSAEAIPALTAEIERRLSPADRARIDARRQSLALAHQAMADGRRVRVEGLADRRPIAPEWAAHCLDRVLDDDTLVIGEAVTNNPVLWHHVRRDTPGSYFQSLGSGLGWGLGAALGAGLGAPARTVVAVVGDGAWTFGSPIAAYWAAARNGAPFLTVIFNNQAYAATVEAIQDGAPDGYARRTGVYPACDLPDAPLYAPIAAALGLWAVAVEDPSRLEDALRTALAEVRSGRSALVDIRVSAARYPDRASVE